MLSAVDPMGYQGQLPKLIRLFSVNSRELHLVHWTMVVLENYLINANLLHSGVPFVSAELNWQAFDHNENGQRSAVFDNFAKRSIRTDEF